MIYRYDMVNMIILFEYYLSIDLDPVLMHVRIDLLQP